jgi:lipopolysaccharide transport system ATP-binding protein
VAHSTPSFAVSLEHVSKLYRIGTIGSDSLRETLANGWRRLFGGAGTKVESNDLWAVDDVSFDVRPGEAVGVIGRNGAGKSTLLKLLSRITEPTRGRILLDGRISSLLEVGTGFHPELTGRENIYLNGSILGMTRAEIRRKYDEIVAFSGVERFLETPVKRYSSGMYVRLAFAVAAHLEPEILIIDEVLAVGDAEFQRKCLGKMSDAATQGRTVLFVSHNMVAVENLCTRAVYLRQGRVVADGETAQVIATYLHDNVHEHNPFVGGVVELHRSGERLLRRIELRCDGQPANLVGTGSDLELSVSFESPDPLRYPVLGVVLRDRYDAPMVAINNKHYTGNLVDGAVRSGTITLRLPAVPLMPGAYPVDIYLGDGSADLEVLRDAFVLEVEARKFSSAGLPLDAQRNRFCITDAQWRFEAALSAAGRDRT